MSDKTPLQSPARKAQVFNQEHPASEAPREATLVTINNTQIEDNYIPLEQDSEQKREWLAAQEARLEAFNAGNPHHAEHAEMLQKFVPLPSSGNVESAGEYQFQSYMSIKMS